MNGSLTERAQEKPCVKYHIQRRGRKPAAGSIRIPAGQLFLPMEKAMREYGFTKGRALKSGKRRVSIGTTYPEMKKRMKDPEKKAAAHLTFPAKTGSEEPPAFLMPEKAGLPCPMSAGALYRYRIPESYAVNSAGDGLKRTQRIRRLTIQKDTSRPGCHPAFCGSGVSTGTGRFFRMRMG